MKGGARRIRLHLLTDGRDCEDGSSIALLQQLEGVLHDIREHGIDARVASGGGRMLVTMDRYEVPRSTPLPCLIGGSSAFVHFESSY